MAFLYHHETTRNLKLEEKTIIIISHSQFGQRTHTHACSHHDSQRREKQKIKKKNYSSSKRDSPVLFDSVIFYYKQSK